MQGLGEGDRINRLSEDLNEKSIRTLLHSCSDAKTRKTIPGQQCVTWLTIHWLLRAVLLGLSGAQLTCISCSAANCKSELRDGAVGSFLQVGGFWFTQDKKVQNVMELANSWETC